MGMINRREMLKLGSAGSLAASILPGSQAIAEIDSGIAKLIPMEDVLSRMDARLLARQRG